MDRKYNEFRVVGRMVNGKFTIDKKEPTARGHVVISARDAETNNAQTRFNFLHYELAENIERKKLEEEANELGVTFRANIGDEKLREKIEEAKK